MEKVAVQFKKPGQKFFDRMTVAEAKKYYEAGEFPPGSMGPKILAAIEFIEETGNEVIITLPERMMEAVRGKDGNKNREIGKVRPRLRLSFERVLALTEADSIYRHTRPTVTCVCKKERCMEVLEAIRTRRSIRKFKDQDVPDDLIDQILTAGIWAPSGMDNQPWRFAVIRDKQIKSEIGKLTIHTDIINAAPVIIPVFLDHHVTFDADQGCADHGSVHAEHVAGAPQFGAGGHMGRADP